MSERVSLIDVYAALRENDVRQPVAAAIATATYRVLSGASRPSEPTLFDAFGRNAGFAAGALGITAFVLAILLSLPARG